MSILAFAGLGADGQDEPEAQMMERMAQDDDARLRAGAVGLPASTIARMRREAGSPAGTGTRIGAGIRIGGRWIGDFEYRGGRMVDHWDPFWGRYDAFLARRRAGLGAETPAAAAMNSWWAIGVLAIVAGGALYWWREGEKRHEAERPSGYRRNVRRRALPPASCRCRAYPFPHRCGAGKCSLRSPFYVGDAEPHPGPKRCSKDAHRRDCRPGRPLCRYRRKAGKGKKGMCGCDAYHYSHRWGGGRCAGGMPDGEKMYAAMMIPGKWR